MAPPRNRVADVLLKAKVVDELQMRSALARLDQWGGRLAKHICDMGLADEDTLTEALSRGFGIQRAPVEHVPKDAAALAKVDVKLCDEKAIFPLSLRDNGKTLLIAMADPSDLVTVDEVGRAARARVQVAIAGEVEIQNAIMRHYRNVEPPKTTGASRARQVVTSKVGSLDDDEDEAEGFKITDMSGKTVVGLKAIRPDEAAAAPPMPAAQPMALGEAPAPAGRRAADLLDDLIGAATFNPEELARLESVVQNQNKSAVILKALTELLQEKGYFSAQDVQTKVKL